MRTRNCLGKQFWAYVCRGSRTLNIGALRNAVWRRAGREGDQIIPNSPWCVKQESKGWITDGKLSKLVKNENEQNCAGSISLCRYYFNLNNDKILRVAD